MSKKWLWLTIAVVTAGAFTAGWVLAQEDRRFPYLPEKYELAYVPTLAEWRALWFTAYQNCTDALSDGLVKTSANIHLADPSCLKVEVDTETQSGWDVYLGNGRFSCSDGEVRAAYEEAAEELMVPLRFCFREIADDDVRIAFAIKSSPVGTWQGGKMTLKGEESSD